MPPIPQHDASPIRKGKTPLPVGSVRPGGRAGPSSDRRSKRLGKRERRWTEGVLEALYPSGATPGMPGAADVNLIDFYEDYVSRLPLLSAVGLRLVVFLVAFTPFLVVGSLRPVHRLSPRRRERHLHRWATSNVYWIREGITLIKAATLMGYGGHPDVQRALGMRS